MLSKGVVKSPVDPTAAGQRPAPPVVRCRVKDGVATVTLNRPLRHNAWTAELETAYFDVLARVDADPSVRVIVVTGSGKSFCPGFDAEAMSSWSASGGQAVTRRRPISFPLSIRKPVVAAINGGCAGIGLYQALLCDVRVASATAKLSTSWARRGLVAEHGEAALLTRLVGHGVATDLLLSARAVTGEEAAELGLVNFAVPATEVLDVALRYAKDLADNCSPRSMAVIKTQIAAESESTVRTSIETAVAHMADPAQRQESSEGIAALMQRRAPSFTPLPAPEGTT